MCVLCALCPLFAVCIVKQPAWIAAVGLTTLYWRPVTGQRVTHWSFHPLMHVLAFDGFECWCWALFLVLPWTMLVYMYKSTEYMHSIHVIWCSTTQYHRMWTMPPLCPKADNDDLAGRDEADYDAHLNQLLGVSFHLMGVSFQTSGAGNTRYDQTKLSELRSDIITT